MLPIRKGDLYARNRRDRPTMSTLTLLVVLLLVLVGVMVFGSLVYLAHRYPSFREPLLVGLAGVAVLAALVTPIVTR
ncbi:hypothetical protein GCM10023084_82150 [Streptomyces lacrimifluminis]